MILAWLVEAIFDCKYLIAVLIDVDWTCIGNDEGWSDRYLQEQWLWSCVKPAGKSQIHAKFFRSSWAAMCIPQLQFSNIQTARAVSVAIWVYSSFRNPTNSCSEDSNSCMVDKSNAGSPRTWLPKQNVEDKYLDIIKGHVGNFQNMLLLVTTSRALSFDQFLLRNLPTVMLLTRRAAEVWFLDAMQFLERGNIVNKTAVHALGIQVTLKLRMARIKWFILDALSVQTYQPLLYIASGYIP